MPGEIIAQRADGYTEYQLVMPGTSYPVILYDSDAETFKILVVACGKKDRASDIFIFDQPEDLRPGNEQILAGFCNEDTFQGQVMHGETYPLSSLSRIKNPVELIVSHSCTMHSN